MPSRRENKQPEALEAQAFGPTPPAQTKPFLLSTEEFQFLTGLGPRQLRRWVKKGKLTKVGILFPSSEVEKVRNHVTNRNLQRVR